MNSHRDREYHLLLLKKQTVLTLELLQEGRRRGHWVRPVFMARKQEGLYYTAVSNLFLGILESKTTKKERNKNSGVSVCRLI